MSEFRWPVRVYYEDTDAGGVVYHTGYIRFMERARTEWLRALGYSQARLAQEAGVLFTVAELSIRYRRPARLDDQLEVVTHAAADGGATVRFQQSVVSADGQELACAEVRVACVDSTNLRPRRLPAELRERIA